MTPIPMENYLISLGFYGLLPPQAQQNVSSMNAVTLPVLAMTVSIS